MKNQFVGVALTPEELPLPVPVAARGDRLSPSPSPNRDYRPDGSPSPTNPRINIQFMDAKININQGNYQQLNKNALNILNSSITTHIINSATWEVV